MNQILFRQGTDWQAREFQNLVPNRLDFFLPKSSFEIIKKV